MTETAKDAVLRAREASDTGDHAAAQEWLERALRLMPGDANIILLLAVAKLHQRSTDAADLFASIAHRYDVQEAWQGLATAHHLQGWTTLATEALSRALGGHAYASAGFAPTADAIAIAADAPGWCAVGYTGRLTVQLVRTLPRGVRPSATLDGRTIALRKHPSGRAFAANLPSGWERAGEIAVHVDGVQLLGSPSSIPSVMSIEGFADTTEGDIHGWAWHPNNPDRDPVLSIAPLGAGTTITVVASDPAPDIRHARPLARPRGFHIDASKLRQFIGPICICGQNGRNLTGSPLDPNAEWRSAEVASVFVARLFPAPARPSKPAPKLFPLPSVPAHIVGSQPRGATTKRLVDVIVPVYNGLDLTLACLESVLSDLPRWARVLVVDDASPDPRVARELGVLARRKHITLIVQTVNRGFPSTANVGMRHDPKRDVVLLNSDTLTPPGWLPRLREAAYAMPEIGSATPLSNDATILSYPSVEHSNAVPQLIETTDLDKLAQLANAGCVVDIPTAVGFCMYIKRDCLDVTGLFREDQFAQGYGEENDFCIRARHLGWRHVAVPSVFVAHVGGQSFGVTKEYLIERNMRRLNRLHPGLDALLREFQGVDPMSEPRRRLDIERWKTFRTRAQSVLLITHGRGGGVQQHVAERSATLRSEGLRPIVLWPVASRTGGGRDCVLGNGPEGGTPNLRFAVPAELKSLARLLEDDRPTRGEVHHLVGHDHALLDLFRRLGIPYDVVIHDYSWFCPRINLIGSDSRYCGEPDVVQCEICVADAGTTNDEDTAPRELRHRSLTELAGASNVITPSQDVAARMQRHFPHIQTKVLPWEDDAKLSPPQSPQLVSNGVRRICLVGAISIEKGYEVLLACARDAAKRSLNLEFRLVGYSCDDARLLATGCVHITGRYEEHDAVALIRAQQAYLGWLTSLWPETWSYTLTQAWQAGLNVVAFDIGAQAERIRSTGRGWLYPLGLPPPVLNNLLLELRP